MSTRRGRPAAPIRHTRHIGSPDDKREIGSRGLYGLSLSSIVLCVVLWIRAKTIGEDERGNAERRAIFVGLWPPMLWLIGDTVRRSGTPRRRRRFGRR